MTDQRQETIDRLKREGGPAFARGAGPEGMTWAYGDPGMSLRDYFAAAALNTFYAEGGMGDRTEDEIARSAYELADAMLAARRGTP